jgi:recombination protein RecA
MESVATALDLSFSVAADVAVRRPPSSVESFSIAGVRPASALEIRPAPDMVPFGIPSLDALTGGVPRGALTEMVGPASSGRTSVILALMAEVTRRQEVCTLVDVTDSFDPASAEAAGVDLKRLLWVRCGKSGSQPSAVSIQPTVQPRANERVAGPTQVHTAVQQAITYGCFEAARGRREFATQATMNKVAPPAKNISWSIHENYDSRLRHAMVNGGESYRSSESWSMPRESHPVRKVVPQGSSARMRSFAEARKAKWDRLDQALKATDLLIQSGGFGLIIVDLGDIPIEQARRVPLTSWFRFRRAVETTPTVLMVIAKDSCAKTCASLVMQVSAAPKQSGQTSMSSPLSHVCLLDGLNVHVELLRTRLERKPVRSATTSLETRALWKKTG